MNVWQLLPRQHRSHLQVYPRNSLGKIVYRLVEFTQDISAPKISYRADRKSVVQPLNDPRHQDLYGLALTRI